VSRGRGCYSRDGLGLVGKELKESGEDTLGSDVDEDGLDSGTSPVLEKSKDSVESSLLGLSRLLVGQSLGSRTDAKERKRSNGQRECGKQLARLWHQGREAYLDEGRSEPNVNKELGSTVLGLGSERLGGGLVAGLEESGEVERHLQEEREQSGMR
jgi:hypothetical protein